MKPRLATLTHIESLSQGLATIAGLDELTIDALEMVGNLTGGMPLNGTLGNMTGDALESLKQIDPRRR